MSEYQLLAVLSQEWIAKAREYERCAEQEDISDEEAFLYKTSAQQYRECAAQLDPFIAAKPTTIDDPKPPRGLRFSNEWLRRKIELQPDDIDEP